MTWAENVEQAVTRYADGQLRACEGIETVDPQTIAAMRETIVAAYLSGAMQLATSLAKLDGGAPHMSVMVAAIEEAGRTLLGHGSQPPEPQ
jgi:hypothetical protein